MLSSLVNKCKIVHFRQVGFPKEVEVTVTNIAEANEAPSPSPVPSLPLPHAQQSHSDPYVDGQKRSSEGSSGETLQGQTVKLLSLSVSPTETDESSDLQYLSLYPTFFKKKVCLLCKTLSPTKVAPISIIVCVFLCKTFAWPFCNIQSLALVIQFFERLS